jgi:hypothetical protein
MPVRAGTLVTLGVEWSSTKGAEWSTGLDETSNGDGECAGPLFREGEDQRVVLFDGLKGELDGLILFIHTDRDLTDVKVRLVLGFECEVLGQVAGSREIAENLSDPLRECAELELLAFHDHQTTSLARLEKK